MKEALNENTLFNTIAMLRPSMAQLLLVVEGDDDYFLLKGHETGDLQLLPGVGGRPNVLAAAAIAERRSLAGVRFLVDADYDAYVSPGGAYPSNVIASRHHDLTMDAILVGLHVLDRVIESHSRRAVRNGKTISPESVRNRAFALAAQVAPLRIVNERLGHGLNLKRFPFGSVASLPPLTSTLVELVIQRSTTTLTVRELIDEIEAETSHVGAADEDLVGDHDLIRALSRVLAEDGVTTSYDALFDSLLAAITCEPIMRTGWHEAVADWCSVNGRTAFACPCAA